MSFISILTKQRLKEDNGTLILHILFVNQLKIASVFIVQKAKAQSGVVLTMHENTVRSITTSSHVMLAQNWLCLQFNRLGMTKWAIFSLLKKTKNENLK